MFPKGSYHATTSTCCRGALQPSGGQAPLHRAIAVRCSRLQRANLSVSLALSLPAAAFAGVYTSCIYTHRPDPAQQQQQQNRSSRNRAQNTRNTEQHSSTNQIPRNQVPTLLISTPHAELTRARWLYVQVAERLQSSLREVLSCAARIRKEGPQDQGCPVRETYYTCDTPYRKKKTRPFGQFVNRGLRPR